jgi:hypothetical protein
MSWLNQTIKTLGYEFSERAIAKKEKLMHLARIEKGCTRQRSRWEKRWVKEGIRNSGLQKHFRTRNSL